MILDLQQRVESSIDERAAGTKMTAHLGLRQHNNAPNDSKNGHWREEAEVPVARAIDREADSGQRGPKHLARVPASMVVDNVVFRPEEPEGRDAHDESTSRLENAQPILERCGFVVEMLENIRGDQEVERLIGILWMRRIHRRRIRKADRVATTYGLLRQIEPNHIRVSAAMEFPHQ